MIARLDRPVVRLFAVLAALALLALTLSGTPSSAAPSRDSFDRAPGSTAASTPVRLVTGDLLRVGAGPDGTPAVAFTKSPTGAAAERSYVRYVDPDGDLHVVPESALAYVGDQLDAGLFNASALARAGVGTTPTDRIPVVVRYTGDAVGVPGVTITRTLPNGDAAGLVDARGAAELGRAIAALDGEAFFAGVAALWLDDGSAPQDDEPTGPTSTVTVEVVPPADGADISGWVAFLGLQSGSFDVFDVAPGSMTIEVELADGPYSASFYGARQAGAQEFRIYGVNAPEFDVNGPTELTLDANDTVEATYALADGSDPTLTALDVTTVRFGDGGSAGVGWSALFFEEARAFLNPTDPVSIGTFDQVVSWTASDDARFYTLPVVMSGEVPDDLAFELGGDDLAEIVSHYSRDVDGEYYIGRFAYTIAGGGSPITPNPAPGQRTDVVTVDGVVTSALVGLDPGLWIAMDRPAVEPIGGATTDEDWITRPIRPGVPSGLKGGYPNRFGDDLNIVVLTFADPDWAFGWGDPGVEQPSIDTVASELRADGEVVYSGTELFGEPITVGPDPATYELTLDVARDADWWLTSTDTSTTWTFDSEHSEEGANLDLLQVEYDVELDPYNHTDTPVEISFRPYNLATPDELTITDFTAEWSIDDGETWDNVVELLEDDGVWTGGIGGYPCNVECTVPVSLRVHATDASGAEIDQSITRAFMATFVEAPPTSPPPTTSEPPTTEPTTEPPTTEPTTDEPTTTATATTTLPGTGGGDAIAYAWVGLLAMIGGGLALVLARRRLAS